MHNFQITARIPHQSAARTSHADSFPPGEAFYVEAAARNFPVDFSWDFLYNISTR